MSNYKVAVLTDHMFLYKDGLFISNFMYDLCWCVIDYNLNFRYDFEIIHNINTLQYCNVTYKNKK